MIENCSLWGRRRGRRRASWVSGQLDAVGFTSVVGEDRMFMTLPTAVEVYRSGTPTTTDLRPLVREHEGSCVPVVVGCTLRPHASWLEGLAESR